jgi:hypothetical protein
MKKKSMFFALATVLIILTCAFAPQVFAAGNPTDTGGHWAEGQVLAGINYGYIDGYPDGTFKPENTISRAEFVKIVNSARNYTAMTNIPFRDVPVNEWYFQEVQKAYQAGYITGDNEGNFNPSAQITRQEVAVILNRIAPGGDTSYALNGVNDANSIDEWALPAVRAVYSRGYITGNDAGNFSPLSPLKRGEAVTIMNRVLGVAPLQPGESLVALSISNLNITDIKTNGATLNITSTRDGNAYWVILEGENATTPTAEQIIGARTSSNGSPAGSGSRAVYANSAIVASSTSLQAEQSYKVCAVVRDAAANVSAVAIRTFTTSGAGDTGEEWLNNNFTVDNIADNSFRLTATSTRAGKLYYVVVEDPNRTVKTPSQSNIRNGKDANGTSANSSTIFAGSFDVYANNSNSYSIANLKGGTNYKVFGCVYENTNTSSLYSTVKSRTFTTTGTNTSWITDFSVTQSGTGSATLNVRADRAGTVYYVVTTDSRTPTAENIRSGSGYGYNNSGLVYASSVYVNANTYASPAPTLSGLTAGTYYYVFYILNTSGSTYSDVKLYNFTASTGTPATALTTRATYDLKTSVGAIVLSGGQIDFAASSSTAYNVIFSAAAAADYVEITITKAAGSVITSTLNTAIVSTSADNRTVVLRGNLVTGTRNTMTFTVSESGRTPLTYNIYIDK